MLQLLPWHAIVMQGFATFLPHPFSLSLAFLRFCFSFLRTMFVHVLHTFVEHVRHSPGTVVAIWGFLMSCVFLVVCSIVVESKEVFIGLKKDIRRTIDITKDLLSCVCVLFSNVR